MRVVHSVSDLPEAGCVLVPTMGALHDGHLSLVRLARARSEQPVVVSVFVNPKQFNDPADLNRYPRELDLDAERCACAGADLVFAPEVATVYPPNDSVPMPTMPGVATEPGLEDAGRPGHFSGVVQVLTRLFDLCQPLAAVFGEKDWQQLQVACALCEMQRRETEIWAGPTVREADGLAMSSRNTHLGPKARQDALALSRALDAGCAASTVAEAERVMEQVLESVGADIQYAAVRDAETLMPLDEHMDRPARALVCAVVGGVRLLDNRVWGGHG
jgi:pantoate--beta-alanine ligase